MQLHGVRKRADGSGEFLFGIRSLLERTRTDFTAGGRFSIAVEMWPDVWLDGLFTRGYWKFHRTCWDALHAAERLELTIETFSDVLARRPGGLVEADALAVATKDATLYLGALVTYFRILADCFATVLPNLYGTRGQQIPQRARDSFRAHRKWFVKNSTFDPGYAEILERSSGWFDELAGEGRGWRDDLTHRHALWQIGFATRPTVQLYAAIDNAPVPGKNLVDELRTAVRQLCAFFDEVLNHFVPRMNAGMKQPLFELSNELEWGCRFFGEGRRGTWLLPPLP